MAIILLVLSYFRQKKSLPIFSMELAAVVGIQKGMTLEESKTKLIKTTLLTNESLKPI